MKNKIKEKLDLISDINLKKCCYGILQNDLFFECVGSVGKHHSYVGGLSAHTLEVINYCLNQAKMFKNADLDVLIASAAWHDFCKIFDYKKEGSNFVEDNQYKQRIHHVTGSTAEFTYWAFSNSVTRDIVQSVQHCILSHHGRREYGSIREPQSLEAILLHQADYLSAFFGATYDCN